MKLQTTKIMAAVGIFVAGAVFICSVQYFYFPTAKWWSREIYDCGVRVAHDVAIAGSVKLKETHHYYGACYD